MDRRDEHGKTVWDGSDFSADIGVKPAIFASSALNSLKKSHSPRSNFRLSQSLKPLLSGKKRPPACHFSSPSPGERYEENSRIIGLMSSDPGKKKSTSTAK